MLKLNNISLIYDEDKEDKTYALRNINLHIEKGQFYGILGPSGSGKSSLLYIASTLKKPSTGSVIYEGRELTKLDDDEVSKVRLRDFGFIFQKHFLIPYMSILENVLVPLNSNKHEDIEKAKELLDSLGLGNKLNKKSYELSGGQCQRVAIARALINNPKIIFADEATASLDHKNSGEVMEILNKLKKDTTILFVTHDKSMTRDSDELIEIWDGMIRGKLDETVK
jgi:putative ABC transport system ATP-binding protein